MSDIRPKRTLLSNEKQMFLNIHYNDIDKKLLLDLFADQYDSSTGKVTPSKFNTYDEFTLNPGESFNKEKIVTNCGLYIVNTYLFEKDLKDVIGYVNKPFDKKVIGSIGDKLATYTLEDETGEAQTQFIEYLNRVCWLSFTFNAEICTSMNLETTRPLPKVEERKKQLLKENKEKLDKADIPTYTRVQDELLDLADKELKNDPAMELYRSGARGSFDNAYRQALIMKGPIYNPGTKKFDIMTNSLYDGASKNDIPSFSNAVVMGCYPKAIGTGECGYLTKKLSAAYQSVVYDKRGSDCKTKSVTEVELTKDIIDLYLYHFMVVGTKLVRLDRSNKDKYIGKTVKMRLPTDCIGKKLCNCCGGDRFYLLGIEDVGITTNIVSGSLLNARMKQAHDTTVRTVELKPDKVLIPFH